MGTIDVVSKTQRISVTARTQRLVVFPDKSVRVVGAGSEVRIQQAGAVGPQGPTGPTGPSGGFTAQRFWGDGPPGTIIGSHPGDEYVDRLTGDIYTQT